MLTNVSAFLKPARDALINRTARQAWLVPLLLTALALAGCGGSSDRPSSPLPPGGGVPPIPTPAPAPEPTILEFSADRHAYVRGDDAVITARFTGGTGHVEPGIGEIQSNVPVTVRDLSGPLELTLVVTSAAGTQSRKLSLAVNYRNLYRPAENHFVALWHTANLLQNGNVMLVGGWRGGLGPAPSGEINVFDTAHRRFSHVGWLRVGRQYHRTVNLADGRLLVTGGDAWLAAPPSAELIYPHSGQVEDTGAPIESRSDHTATVLDDGRVLVVGGIGSSDDRPFGISDTAELWDPATGQFRLAAGTLATARVGHSAHLLPDGRVLIVGGWTIDTDYVLAEIFDPATETFAAVPSPDNRVRMEHASVQLADGSVLVLGGGVLGEDPAAGLMPDRSVLRFFADGTGAEILPDLAEPRALPKGALGEDGRVYLFGGMAGWHATAQAEAYSPTAGSEAIASLSAPLYNHTVTRLADGRFLIAGGENETIDLVPLGLVYE